MDKRTQVEKIVDYCKSNGSITQKEAMMHLNVYRLASRICDIKKSGLYEVEAKTETGANGSHYARYFITEVAV